MYYSILIYNKTLIQMPNRVVFVHKTSENYESIHVYADNYSKNWYEKTNRIGIRLIFINMFCF